MNTSYISHIQSVCDENTLYVKNQIYEHNIRQFIFPHNPMPLRPFVTSPHINKSDYNEQRSLSTTVTIDHPVFVIDTVDGNVPIALIDGIMVWYWTYMTYMHPQKITFFVRKRMFDYFPGNLDNLNATQTGFKYIYQQFLNVIPHYEILFEHKLENTYNFTHCFHHILEDKHQRSLWNKDMYMSGRLKNNPLYTDEDIFANVYTYINACRLSLNCSRIPDTYVKRIAILENKYEDFMDETKCTQLSDRLEENNTSDHGYIFDGIVVLDELSLREQLMYLSHTHVIFVRHGSFIAHLLWLPQNSLVFVLDNQYHRKPIVQRLCQISNSHVVYCKYDQMEIESIIRTLNAYLRS